MECPSKRYSNTYDTQSPVLTLIIQYAEKNKYIYGGATKDAATRAALFSLTVVPGRSHRLPDEDDITFGFKSSRDGEEYTVTTPV